MKGVIVAAEGEGVLRKLWRARGWEVAYVAVEKGEILRALMAWFLPRAYGFNPHGELVGRQESPEGTKGKDYQLKP